MAARKAKSKAAKKSTKRRTPARKAARAKPAKKTARKSAKAPAKAKAKPARRPKANAPAAKSSTYKASSGKTGKTGKKKSGYELKTKATGVSVDAFLDAIPDERRRNDARAVLKMMQDITGELPKMWGPSIVGFGKYHYRYASGHEGDMCIAGFSPRSTALTLYVVPGFERDADLMGRLGKFSTGKSCLYSQAARRRGQGRPARADREIHRGSPQQVPHAVVTPLL